MPCTPRWEPTSRSGSRHGGRWPRSRISARRTASPPRRSRSSRSRGGPFHPRRSATRSPPATLPGPGGRPVPGSSPTRGALGRRFVLDGEVVTGHGRGKGLGYPTANLRTRPRLLLPGQGIYAGVAEHRGRRYRTAFDVGTNPTFGVEPLHVEAFLLDYDGPDLPGEPLSIEFWARLRDEERYEDVGALVDAIEADVARTRAEVPAEALA